MDHRELDPQGEQALEQVLGYLNFSAGNPDPQFLGNLNVIYGKLLGMGVPEPLWRETIQCLESKLTTLAGSSPTFSDSEQGFAVLKLARDHVLPGYREFHRDLLFHQTDEALFLPFFLARVFEAILPPRRPLRDAADKITQPGNRPFERLHWASACRGFGIAKNRTLSAQNGIQPDPSHFIFRGAGISRGISHYEVVETALYLLKETDADLLRSAQFDPSALEELAFDPRAYDFDHPVNKRPNYHFGQWDPHQIDNQGRYRRYVRVQSNCSGMRLMKRIDDCGDLPREEAVFWKLVPVLAGTIIMASVRRQQWLRDPESFLARFFCHTFQSTSQNREVP